ncbi:hypothetical protein BST92_08985 [Nonlabens arenilitoris]|uniref:Paraquat-inducible protein A n=1 Tax=Nonlabens arenilitoris TaxID=1217969 RepID=A0A2S7UBS8_9FLAO|nr:paraquat-inducible protein A [Nonlabens arenilitoris]PQJ32051.1 hypothetical protein BST92_08985 [Nonlabens arenilitoris]
MKTYFRTISVIILFIVISLTSLNIYQLEKSNRILKADLTELSDIKYGLFNVDVWKEKIATIITKKIDELEITDKNREKNKQKIIKFLEIVIKDFEQNFKEKNRKESLFGISYKNIGADTFSVFSRLNEEIPSIADKVLNFLEEKENKDKIKAYIISKLDEYTDKTFQKVDYSVYDSIHIKYNAKNISDCIIIINSKREAMEARIDHNNYLILFLFVILLVMIIKFKNTSKFEIISYSTIAIVLLSLGITLPMIDIDARIELMEFDLLGESLSFKNQVLYFKSKSILEMANLMLFHSDLKIFFVGLLVLSFSVLFPLCKIISTILVLFYKKLKNNLIINFLVFKSGKWSMADVMVVAIFMSYIGFTGIISSQLSQLEKISTKVSILTTNDSDIQSGFFFFTGFVILGIFISQMISKQLELKNTKSD